MEHTDKLSDSVAYIEVGEKQVYLVGTAHVSKESVEDVKNTIELVQPDTVCVELCQGRYDSIVKKDAWEKMDIFKIIREKKAAFLLTQLVMSSFYRRLGDKLGIKPGAEMIEGIEGAEAAGSELVLADRDIKITLKRVWGYLGFWNKLKLAFHLMASLFITEKVDENLVESLKKKDQLEAIMEEFADKFPEIKKRLIDERDIYLSQKIRSSAGSKVVAVVGAGHIEGIKKHIQQYEPLDELMEIPSKSAVSAVIKWGIPTAIIALIAYGFFKDGTQHSLYSIAIWVFVNGTLSAIGAAVALAHPVTIISAFIAAPLTSLNPMIAAGWVAGLVQAYIARPTVEDFEDLPNAIASVKGFWTNPVTKILLVCALANVGSMLGTWIAATWIFTRTV